MGTNERSIAGQFTLEIYFMLRGETAQTAAGFNRPINYNPGRCPNRSMEPMNIEWEPMNVMQRKFRPIPCQGSRSTAMRRKSRKPSSRR